MLKKFFNIRKIIVEKNIASEPLTRKILSKFKDLPVEYTNTFKHGGKSLSREDFLVASQKGKFLKKCPGTPSYACCDYYVLNLGIGCHFNCTYCFLHYYMNTPFTIFTNIADAIEEVENYCSKSPSKIIRLGTGEFIDSLGFDEITGFNKTLVPELSKIDNILFEIKTKSSNVNELLSLKHRGRVVISFSVNSEEVIKKEESQADSLSQRLRAARKCEEAGYKIGFHFDPLIYYEGWEDDYKKVVEQIFRYIEAEHIAWISLGALRLNKTLKPVIQKKFPDSEIIYEEMAPGLDGKLRYFITIRKKLFRFVNENIKLYSKEIPVYLCMENKELAEEVGVVAGFTLN